MPILVTGVVFLAIYSVWQLGLAVRSARAARPVAAVRAPQPARRAGKDGGSATTDVLWLVLINPTAATLAVVRGLLWHPSCQVRLLIAAAEHNAAHWLADEQVVRSRPGEDRAALLNRAHRVIMNRSQRERAKLSRVVVGILDEGARPAEDLPSAVARAFADPKVGAVQARVRVAEPRLLDSAQQLELGVIGDALELQRSRHGSADLTGYGSFFRLSALHAQGFRPWRAVADEERELGRRLLQAGMRVRRDRGVGVVVGSRSPRGVLREQARAAQSRLQEWPRGGRVSERAGWLARLAAWLAPAVLVVGAVAALGGVAATGGSSRVLVATAVVWAAVIMVPAMVWWAARRDQSTRSLRQGALLRPILLLCRPYVLGWALLRQARGEHTWRLEPRSELPAAERGTHRAVFVDTTGRRRRMARLVVYSTVVAGLAYLAIFAYSMSSRPVIPYSDTAQPYRAYPRPTPSDGADDGITDDTVADSIGEDLARRAPTTKVTSSTPPASASAAPTASATASAAPTATASATSSAPATSTAPATTTSSSTSSSGSSSSSSSSSDDSSSDDSSSSGSASGGSSSTSDPGDDSSSAGSSADDPSTDDPADDPTTTQDPSTDDASNDSTPTDNASSQDSSSQDSPTQTSSSSASGGSGRRG